MNNKNSLLLKAGLVFLAAGIIFVLVLALMLFSFSQQKNSDYYRLAASSISQNIQERLASNDPQNTDWNQFLANASTNNEVLQLNLISSTGIYLGSTDSGYRGRQASPELLKLVSSAQNNLKEIDIDSVSKSVWQYVQELQLGRTDGPVYLQILFEPDSFYARLYAFRQYLLVLAIIEIFLSLLCFSLIYQFVLSNIRKLQNPAKNKKINVDAEFIPLQKDFADLSKTNSTLTSKVADLNVKLKQGKALSDGLTDAVDEQHLFQFILGIKIKNISEALGTLKSGQFSFAISKLYELFYDVLNKQGAHIVHFDGHVALASFPGGNPEIRCLQSIKDIKTKAESFSVEYKFKLSKALDFLFLISKGSIYLTKLKVADGRTFMAYGGGETVATITKLTQLEQGEIWAESELNDLLSKYCFTYDLRQLGHNWDGFEKNLISVSFDSSADSKLKRSQGPKSSSGKPKADGKAGIKDILDETLNQK